MDETTKAAIKSIKEDIILLNSILSHLRSKDDLMKNNAMITAYCLNNYIRCGRLAEDIDLNLKNNAQGK